MAKNTLFYAENIKFEREENEILKGVSLEIKKSGLESLRIKDIELIYEKLRTPNAERIFFIADAIRFGMSLEEINKMTSIDPWFLYNIKEIIDTEKEIIKNKSSITKELLTKAKEYGFSDKQLGGLLGKSEEEAYNLRKSMNIAPNFKLVDTCAAEFRAFTPYYYSTYDR